MAKMVEIYIFSRSNTMKITFTISEMERKAKEHGLLMFYLSVAPSQIEEEI